MSDLNLNHKYLDMLLADLDAVLPESEVWAFGSRVSGGCHSGSDIDIVVRNPADLTIPVGQKLAELKERISEGNIPILVDVLDWALIPDSFRNEISQNYLIIKPGAKGGKVD